MEPTRQNIPPARTSFIGRGPDLEALGEALADHALVTLLGSGGAGKTRLAAHYGATCDRFDTVYFCDLASARTVDEIVAAVAEALGLEAAGQTTARQLGHALASRGELLLILDNLEQAIEPAADVVRVWLDEAADLTVLATSREPLRLRGERQFKLPPLGAEAAVELLVERARLVRPGFQADDQTRQTLEAIVDRLDALPLAIELAASRLKLLSPPQLLSRLESSLDVLRGDARDRVARHQTIHATIAWSWELLAERDQQALAECTVFRGGFSLEAAQAVLLGGADDAAERLEALVDKSLARLVSDPDEPARLDLFETIRHFAAQRLDGECRRRAERAHAEYYVELLDEVRGSDLGEELPNIEAAFHRMTGRDDQLAARAALACYRLLRTRGQYGKIFEIVDQALQADLADDALASKLHAARGLSLAKKGRYTDALADIDRGLALIEGEDAPRSLIFLQTSRASILRKIGRTAEAPAALAEALSAVEPLDDPWLETIIRGHGGVTAWELGDLEEARRIQQDVTRLARRHGVDDIAAYAMRNEAHYATEMGDETTATRLLDEACALHPGADHGFEIEVLFDRGQLALRRGDQDSARACFLAALEADRRIGDELGRVPFLLGLSQLEPRPQTRPPDSYLREVWDILAATDDHPQRVQARCQLGVHALERLELAEACRLLTAAHEEAERTLDARIATHVGFWRAVAQAAPDSELFAVGDDLPRSFADDAESFAFAAALAAARTPPDRTEVRTVLDALRATSAQRRSRPLDRLYRWRGWDAHAHLARVIDRLAGQLEQAQPSHALQVACDGTAFCPPGGEPVDLSTRQALALILARLSELRDARPGEGLTVEALVATGWPDDVVTESAGRSRVYTAIRTLRRMGLDGLLLTGDAGYHLDPNTAFVWL